MITNIPTATPPKTGPNKGSEPKSQISGKASAARVGKQYGTTGSSVSGMPTIHQ